MQRSDLSRLGHGSRLVYSLSVKVIQSHKGEIEHMFCYQCEQTNRGQGCTERESAAKTIPRQHCKICSSRRQGHRHVRPSRASGRRSRPRHDDVCDRHPVCNRNQRQLRSRASCRRLSPAPERFAIRRKKCMSALVGSAAIPLAGPPHGSPQLDRWLGRSRQAESDSRQAPCDGPEVGNLQELILYGLKGLGAYAAHAKRLGATDPPSTPLCLRSWISSPGPRPRLDELLTMALRTGELNYRVMQLLDKANTDAFGHPQPRRAPASAQRQGHLHLRPRPGRSLRIAEADRWHRHPGLHARRDAACPRLSRS